MKIMRNFCAMMFGFVIFVLVILVAWVARPKPPAESARDVRELDLSGAIIQSGAIEIVQEPPKMVYEIVSNGSECVVEYQERAYRPSTRGTYGPVPCDKAQEWVDARLREEPDSVLEE